MTAFIKKLSLGLKKAKKHFIIGSILHQIQNVISYLRYLFSDPSKPIKTNIRGSYSVADSVNEDKILTNKTKVQKIESDDTLEELLMELKRAIEEDEDHSEAMTLSESVILSSMTLDESYFLINRIQILYAGLEEGSQTQLLISLNKNPIAHILKYPPESPDDLMNFENYDEYFLYQPIKDDERVYYVRKKDLLKVRNNLNALVQNEWIKMPWKLN